MFTSITYRGVKGDAAYTATCGHCNKTVNRKAVVEHTVNPFNTNVAGEIKSVAEVRSDAYEAAKLEAASLQGTIITCRDCEDADNRALLLEMLKDPDGEHPEPDDYWRSPMRVLEERKHVQRDHKRCTCGAPCCSGYSNKAVFRLTKKGKERAANLLKNGR